MTAALKRAPEPRAIVTRDGAHARVESTDEGERLTVHGAPPADFAALIESLFGVKDAVEELAAPPVSSAGPPRG